MVAQGSSLFVCCVILGVCCAGQNRLGDASAPAKLERIEVRPDGKGFRLAELKHPFVPWGLNYGNKGRLMEDFWEKEWTTIEGDFREMKALGANVVRVHLQVGHFMSGPEAANEYALDRFGRMLTLAEECGLYLDVTGLACYRTPEVPAWYDALDEAGRWSAQAAFWEAVARRCAGSSAVFCYCLINEPISPGQKRGAGEWSSGKLFGGYDFVQSIALDPGGRRREDIAAAWVKRMTAAIRKHDKRHLVTVGLLPWSRQWKHLSGFLPAKIAPHLDFISVHIYPKSGEKFPVLKAESRRLETAATAESLEGLRQFAVGKPVVIEETFPLTCSVAELESFLRASREVACGWMGHYDGTPLEELESAGRTQSLSVAEALMRDWLRLFQRLRPEFVAQ
ncbi:MAG: cellulase family glycosylhydrolase [Verrucomicrobiales bacterium]